MPAWNPVLTLTISTVCAQFLAQYARGEEEDDFQYDEDIGADLPLTSSQIRELLLKFDTNRDGKGSMNELVDFAHDVRKERSRKDIPHILEELDKGRKDGKLSMQEILKDIEGYYFEGDDQKLLAARKALDTKKFKLADEDGDGLLNQEEMHSFFNPESNEAILNLTVEANLKEKDRNNDGKLDPRELWDISGESKGQVSAEELTAFGKLDKNKDGYLNVDEFTDWESGRFHTSEALQKIFELGDSNKDNQITVPEFDAAKAQIAGTDAQYHLMEWASHFDL